MALKPVPFTDAAGVIWIEMRDAESNAFVSRYRAPAAEQSLKVQRLAELRLAASDWRSVRELRAEAAGLSGARLTKIATGAGLTGMTQAQVVAFLQELEDALLIAYLAGMNEWRQS